MRMVSMAAATYPCGNCDASVLLWDPDKVAELKAQVFSDSLLAEEYASIEVLNGTEISGLAGIFADYMPGKGVDPLKIQVDEFADGLLYDTTIVIDVNGTAGYTAQKIAEWLNLPGGRVLQGSDPQAEPFLDGATSEVIVVLGADAELPSAALAGTQTGG
jgi:hypothetical protein